MTIIIRNTAGEPIYEQIKAQVKAAIYSDELTEGEALPSIRQLARDLKISVITTTRAYNDLEQEGFVASVPGKGFYVLPQNMLLAREQAVRAVEEQFTQAITLAKQVGMARGEFDEILETIAKEYDYEHESLTGGTED